MAIKSACDDPQSILYSGRNPETGAKPGGFYNETVIDGVAKQVYVNPTNMVATPAELATMQSFVFEP